MAFSLPDVGGKVRGWLGGGAQKQQKDEASERVNLPRVSQRQPLDAAPRASQRQPNDPARAAAEQSWEELYTPAASSRDGGNNPGRFAIRDHSTASAHQMHSTIDSRMTGGSVDRMLAQRATRKLDTDRSAPSLTSGKSGKKNNETMRRTDNSTWSNIHSMGLPQLQTRVDNPSGATRTRWEFDPLRESSWQWSCTGAGTKAVKAGAQKNLHQGAQQRFNDLKNSNDLIRLNGAIETTRECLKAAEEQALYMSDDDIKVRQNAMKILAILGVNSAAQFVKVLPKVLAERDDEIKRIAMESIAKLGHVAALACKEAIENMKHVPSEAKSQALREATEAAKPPARLERKVRLGKKKGMAESKFRFTMGESMRDVAPELGTHKDRQEKEVDSRKLAVELVAENPAKVYAALTGIAKSDVLASTTPPWHLASLFRKCMKHQQYSIREEAAKMLSGMAAAGGKHLARQLDNVDPDVRRTSARSLCEIGLSAGPHLEALARRLDDDDPDVYIVSCRALANLGNSAKHWAHKIGGGLESEDQRVRKSSSYALDSILRKRDANRSWRTTHSIKADAMTGSLKHLNAATDGSNVARPGFELAGGSAFYNNN